MRFPGRLAESDLDTFIRLVRQAEERNGPIPDRSPDATLRADGDSDGLLHRAECARLWKSLRIACAAGLRPGPVDAGSATVRRRFVNHLQENPDLSIADRLRRFGRRHEAEPPW